jgi:hypothetical protein
MMEDITPEDSVVPVYLVPPTVEQEAEREQWALDALAREKVLADELTAKEGARASAYAKLAKLGLTPDEIAAITS